MKNDPLLQPFTLKHLQLKNRIFSASHEPSYSENGLPTERYELYQEEEARGGIGLTMFRGNVPDHPPETSDIVVFRSLASDAVVSCVREPAHRSFPKPMEDLDIERVVRTYGAGARRRREGGLDGAEIEAYGHLFDAFWAERMKTSRRRGTQSPMGPWTWWT